jgi:hypothetical protein
VVVVDQAWINANQSQNALFFDRAGDRYQFTVDFSAPGTAVFVLADNITIDLNGKTITFNTANRSGTMGINALGGRSQFEWGTDDRNYSRASGGSGANNLLVKNGRIFTNGGNFAVGVGGVYSGNLIAVDNMFISVNGKDAHCVLSNWSALTVTNTYCNNTSNSTNDRHMLPGNIKTSGRVTAYNNILIGGNSSIVPGNSSVIYNNVLRHSGFATNGYGINIYENSNVRAYNNLIVPFNGRGFMDSTGSGNQAYDNLILVHEAPNPEFGKDLNAPCLRARYGANNLSFYNNRCLGVAGGLNTATSGAYLGGSAGKVNNIYKNEFRVILGLHSRDNQYANAITFEGHGSADAFVSDQITGNLFKSNNYILRLSGFDGGSYQKTIRANTLEWVSGDDTYTWFVQAIDDPKYNFSYPPDNIYVTPQELQNIKNTVKAEVQSLIAGQPNNPSRSTIFAGFYNFDSHITLVDTILQPGIGLQASDVLLANTIYSYAINIKVGHSLHVIAQDVSGKLLKNRTITVSDNTGNTFTGSTDATGYTRLELIDYALLRNGSQSTVSKVLCTGHTANSPVVGSKALPVDVRNSESTPYILRFERIDSSPSQP